MEYIAINLPVSGQLFHICGGPCMIYHEGEDDYRFFWLNIAQNRLYKASSIEDVLRQHLGNALDSATLNKKSIFTIKNSQICYKVVREDNGVFCSCSVKSTSLDYKLSNITYPTIGKIFVFKELKDAQKFAVDNGVRIKLTILKCECSNMSPIYRRTSVTSTFNEIKYFWQTGNIETYPVPDGTFGVDWVKPIEEM